MAKNEQKVDEQQTNLFLSVGLGCVVVVFLVIAILLFGAFYFINLPNMVGEDNKFWAILGLILAIFPITYIFWKAKKR